MAGNAPAVSTGMKEFGTIANNRGVVFGDASGYTQVIGMCLVHIEYSILY